MDNNEILHYKKMLEIRWFEKRVFELIKNTDLARYTHLSLGREPLAATISLEYVPGDSVVATYRNHGIALALGMSAEDLLKEILNYNTSSSQGFGGSLHIVSCEHGLYDSNGIIGGGLPISAGLGFYRKLKKNNKISWCFFGDGAVQSGIFHESLNFSAKHRLPVIFICENNGTAMTTPFETVSSVKNVSDYANVYGIIGEQLEVNQVEDFIKRISLVVSKVRNGHGPALLEIKVPNLCPHSAAEEFDFSQIDIPEDPVYKYTDFYSKKGYGHILEEIESEVKSKITEPFNFWQSDDRPLVPLVHNEGESTYRKAIQETIEEIMTEDPNIIMLGTALERSPFYKKFGVERVISTPIAENSVVGIAHGLALDGKKPIVDLMMAGFSYVAADQIINQLAMGQFYRNNNQAPNVLIRALIGTGEAMGAQHSQNPHGFFMHIPGLKILYPSFPEDASGLLNGTIGLEGPVIFFEHILLRNVKGNKSKQPYQIGKLSRKRVGTDITFVAVGAMVHVCLTAANELEKNGIDVEVLDLMTVAPVDLEGIYTSIKKTGRVIVVDEAWPCGGLANYIIAQIAMERLTYLKSSPKCLTLPHIGMPASKELLHDIIPSVEKLCSLTNEIMKN